MDIEFKEKYDKGRTRNTLDKSNFFVRSLNTSDILLQKIMQTIQSFFLFTFISGLSTISILYFFPPGLLRLE